MLYGFRISDSTYNKTLVSKVRSDLDFPASTKPEILCRGHDKLLTQTPRTFQGKLPYPQIIIQKCIKFDPPNRYG